MQIHELKVKKAKSIKRIGRGGKKGTYSGKGMKGQTSRSGFSQRSTFEGGMSSLIARTKKNRGFKSLKSKNQVLDLNVLEKMFDSGTEITGALLIEKKLMKAESSMKILANGEVSKKFSIKGLMISAAAKEKIEKAGGKIEA